MSVHFGLLGPVELSAEGRMVEVGPPQRRAVLALLLLAAGQSVTVAALRERIWARNPPTSSATAIQVHVHHLRRILMPLTSGANGGRRPRLLTHPGFLTAQVSYELDVAPGTVDVMSFRNLLDEGELACGQRENARALARFEAALSLWRGPALPELQPSAYVLNIRQSLTDMRREAAKQRAACLLRTGSLTSAVDALQGLHTKHPDDERIVVLLSTALHRMGSEGRAMHLVTNQLDRWQRDHGVLPPTLLRQRDLMFSGAPLETDETGGAV